MPTATRGLSDIPDRGVLKGDMLRCAGEELVWWIPEMR